MKKKYTELFAMHGFIIDILFSLVYRITIDSKNSGDYHDSNFTFKLVDKLLLIATLR